MPHPLPKVTIGIPTYRQAHTVTEAIQSALAQTYPDLEVVVADDASPDETTNVVAPLLSDKRLRYVRNENNTGRVGNYKKLLYEYATGDWYLNLDGDDYLTDPQFVERAMAQVGADPEIVLVQATASVQLADGSFKKQPETRNEVFEVLDGTAFLLQYPERYRTYHLGALYNRAKAMTLHFYRSDTLRSDTESLLRLALQGKVAYHHEPVGVWRDNGANETWLLNSALLPKEKAVFDAIAAEAVKKISPSLVHRWKERVKERVDLYFVDSYLSRHSIWRNLPFVWRHAHPRPAFVKMLVKHALRSFGKR